ncbi:MAG TPA: maleylpyruvate isomerase N-terminal domain-containing protein [Candidatus Limnocylindrales bacterium]|nr:maleylpyruvate isomerase N-terminal domain-containing protein [Candidatus Limnocylindrales bacterium]
MQSRDAQVAAIRADQLFWRSLAAEVGPARYAEPGPMGAWSFGDLAGHLVGWRNRTIARLEAFANGEPEPAPPWPTSLDDDDRINDWIHEHHASRTPTQLVADYDASYDRLIRALSLLADEQLMTTLEWVGAPLIEVDFTGHLHDEHVAGVRAWLDRA